MALAKREGYWKGNKIQVKKLEGERTKPNGDEDHATPETTTQQRLVPQSINITEQHHHCTTSRCQMANPLPANHYDKGKYCHSISAHPPTVHTFKSTGEASSSLLLIFLLNNVAIAANHKNF
jgi:hypothetical protein